MKMVNKILLGTLAVAAVLSIAGCKKGDDTEEAITGKNNDYGINYTNNSDSMYRAYHLTSLNHAGDLVKITFENPDDCADSKMGVIFGYQEANGARKFAIIGLGANRTGKNFYVSIYNNVTDIQADNFGAASGANETEVVHYTESNKITLPAKNQEGHVVVYVAFKAKKDGKYEYAVLDINDNQANSFSFHDDQSLSSDLTAANIQTANILSKTSEGASTYGVAETPVVDNEANNSYKQRKLAVYAMVQAKKTLKGKWQYKKDFHAAEEIEE